MAKITFTSKKDPSVEYGHRNEITKEDMQKKVLGELNEWQLCPKCNGSGSTIFSFMSTNYVLTENEVKCDLCNGKKIISKVNGQPPQ